MRVRALHATVLRRIELFTSHDGKLPTLPVGDALVDATVLIAGRGPLYPTLSVAMGERVKVAGAAIEIGADDVDALVKAAQKRLGKAASSGVIHKNAAARRKSRLHKQLNKLAADAEA